MLVHQIYRHRCSSTKDGDRMGQMSTITSYVSKSKAYSLAVLTLFCWGFAICQIFLLGCDVIWWGTILSILPPFGLYFLAKNSVLYARISSRNLVSKFYGFKCCELSWDKINYIAIFIGVTSGNYARIWSPYILLSSDVIENKHCYLASYKPRTQIAIRIGEDNADTILPIINEKLGLSLTYEQLTEVEFRKPLMLELSNRQT